MKFAILGAGVIADAHHRAIKASADLGAELVAIGHYNPARFESISAAFGVPCMAWDDILNNPEIDVVAIITPSGQHAEQTIAAAKAGKHVLVEKPMALNPADADAMLKACDTAGVKLGVTFQSRSLPLFQRMQAAIAAGDLGDLTVGLVSMPYYRPASYFEQADWRGTWALDGGGVLMNQGIHQVDLLIWLMGEPVDIKAHAATLHRDIEVEDTLSATLRFANGALATVVATTTAASGFPHRLEIYGTNGGIRTEGDRLQSWVLADQSRATVEAPQIETVKDAGAGSDPRGGALDKHNALYRDFILAIQEDREPLVNGIEGRRSVVVVDAIYRAASLI